MRIGWRIGALVVAASACVPAAHAVEGSETFTLAKPRTLAGVRLEPGKYRVEWQGEGPAVSVSIRRGGRTVADAGATLVEVAAPRGDTAVIAEAEGGPGRIVEMRFRDRAQALRFEPEGSAPEAPAAAEARR